MTNLLDYPYRILIVEDEQRDWAAPMQAALQKAATEAKYQKLTIDIAYDHETARNLLAQYHFQIISLDMRLPERSGESITSETGVKLAQSFPFIGFPKSLIYSQTLRDMDIKERPADAVQVLQIPRDKYAKPTGSDADSEAGAVEVLKVRDWAERIIASLNPNCLKLPKSSNPNLPERLTLLGAYFEYGAELLPPLLARHIQELSNYWDSKDARRVDAAIKFIECTARLALAQCVVLLEQTTGTIFLPEDDHMSSCLKELDALLPNVPNCNFKNYLPPAALLAFRAALKTRNDVHHTLASNNPKQAWEELRKPLQFAMDVATYWVCHPLCQNLRYSRDGWSAELLAGTATPRKRRLLPAAMDFPTEATSDGVWQNVWNLKQAEPQIKTINWDQWLHADSQSEQSWWLLMHSSKQKQVFCDLNSGNTKTI